MASNVSIPPPPRMTGDPAIDQNSLNEWAQKFYTGGVRESRLLDPGYQSDPGTFDEDNLPDPTDTPAIAKAQDVANRGYQLARKHAAFAPLDVTFDGTTASVEVPLSAALEDARYTLQFIPKASSGTPASGAFTVKSVTREADKFTVEVVAAPGSGNSVTLEATLFRQQE